MIDLLDTIAFQHNDFTGISTVTALVSSNDAGLYDQQVRSPLLIHSVPNTRIYHNYLICDYYQVPVFDARRLENHIRGSALVFLRVAL